MAVIIIARLNSNASEDPGLTPLRRRRRCRGDAGLVATVIVLPALLLSFWLVLQYAVAAHVRHVAQAAAQDAALAAASGAVTPARRCADRRLGRVGWPSDVGVGTEPVGRRR